MYMANIKYADIGNALKTGYNIKKKKLDIAESEEDAKDKIAENEFFGNYLAKTDPSNVVEPVDENENGIIDPEEKKNAIQQTGRKYKAWDKVRDDEQISDDRKDVMAKRAAHEGREIRRENRMIESHKQTMEKNKLAKEQDAKLLKQYTNTCKDLGYTGQRLDECVSLAGEDREFRKVSFAQLDTNDKIKKTAETDTALQIGYDITKTYTENLGENKTEADRKRASAAALEKLDPLIEAGEQVLAQAKEKGDKEMIVATERRLNQLKKMKGKDGQFNYQAAQGVAKEIALEAQDETLQLDNDEHNAMVKEYLSGKSKGKGKDTAMQKNLAKDEEIFNKDPKDWTEPEYIRARKVKKNSGGSVFSAAGVKKIVDDELKEKSKNAIQQKDRDAFKREAKIKRGLAVQLSKAAWKLHSTASSEDIAEQVDDIYNKRYAPDAKNPAPPLTNNNANALKPAAQGKQIKLKKQKKFPNMANKTKVKGKDGKYYDFDSEGRPTLSEDQ